MYSHLITVVENRNQYKPCEMDGIPLSPEILVNAGFAPPVLRPETSDWSDSYDLDGVDFNGVTDIHSIDGWYICLYDGKWYHCYENAGYDEEAHIYTIGIGFEHLHQLQNLYHALTGKELNIEL
jgi:hypothetical protein